MKKRDDKVFLWHILDAIERIQGYVKSSSYEQFINDYLLQDGVIRQLEILGESANNISEDYQRNHPEIPWTSMIGLRNQLIHVYFDVDLALIWDTILKDLPPLKFQLEGVLRKN